jgi:UDP-N-acetylmuramoyl-L-alanyl-D-glutamate--2,6-diaminopimelate ligase
MVAKVLEAGGHKVALASTINFKICEKEWVNTTKMTTLSSFSVQKFLAQALRRGCEYVVLEVSSHSLDQNRVWGIPFHIAIITNITREHLDYHVSMEKYRQAKLKLFCRAKTAIVNLDLNEPEEFLNDNLERAYFYTISDNALQAKAMVVRAESVSLSPEGSKFRVKNEEWDQEFTLNLPGKFNVENALAAICMGISEDVRMSDVARALSEIKLVPGRMEKIPNGLGLDIFVDYAVTPDSLEKLYEYLSDIRSK